jgi:transposase
VAFAHGFAQDRSAPMRRRICEAAQRPTMRFVQPKTAEVQGAAVIFRAHDLLVRQITQQINALRGHLVETPAAAA